MVEQPEWYIYSSASKGCRNADQALIPKKNSTESNLVNNGRVQPSAKAMPNRMIILLEFETRRGADDSNIEGCCKGRGGWGRRRNKSTAVRTCVHTLGQKCV